MQGMMIPPQGQSYSQGPRGPQGPQQVYAGQYHGTEMRAQNTQYNNGSSVDFGQVDFQQQSQAYNGFQQGLSFPTAISPDGNSIQRQMQTMQQFPPLNQSHQGQAYRPFPQSNIWYPTSFDGVTFNGNASMESLGYNTQISVTGSENHRYMGGSGSLASQPLNDPWRKISNIDSREDSGFESGYEDLNISRLSASSQNASFQNAASPRQQHAQALADMIHTFPVVPQSIRDEYLAAKKLQNPSQPKTRVDRVIRTQEHDKRAYNSPNANYPSTVQTGHGASSLPNAKPADLAQSGPQEQESFNLRKRPLRSPSPAVSTQEMKRARTVHGPYQISDAEILDKRHFMLDCPQIYQVSDEMIQKLRSHPNGKNAGMDDFDIKTNVIKGRLLDAAQCQLDSFKQQVAERAETAGQAQQDREEKVSQIQSGIAHLSQSSLENIRKVREHQNGGWEAKSNEEIEIEIIQQRLMVCARRKLAEWQHHEESKARMGPLRGQAGSQDNLGRTVKEQQSQTLQGFALNTLMNMRRPLIQQGQSRAPIAISQHHLSQEFPSRALTYPSNPQIQQGYPSRTMVVPQAIQTTAPAVVPHLSSQPSSIDIVTIPLETTAHDIIDPELPTALRPDMSSLFCTLFESFSSSAMAPPTSPVVFDTSDTGTAHSPPQMLARQQAMGFTSLALENGAWMETIAQLLEKYETD
jgi:hypothetical protein